MNFLVNNNVLNFSLNYEFELSSSSLTLNEE